MTPLQIVVNFFIALLVGSLTAYMSKGRGRNPVPWFFIGMFFGILGFLALFLFPIVKDEPARSIARTLEPQLPEKWFYLDEKHVQFGPVGLSELALLYKETKIEPSTYVWSEGMEEWKKLGELSQLLTQIKKL